jgi:hypothetical protein
MPAQIGREGESRKLRGAARRHEDAANRLRCLVSQGMPPAATRASGSLPHGNALMGAPNNIRATQASDSVGYH